MRRAVALLPLAALVLLAGLFLGFSLKRNPQVAPDALVGRPLPALSLPALVTDPAEVARPPVVLRQEGGGAPYLLNVFASWCAPCRVEHPVLEGLAAQGVRVVGVAYKDEPAATARFLAELGNPFAAVAVDRDGAAGLELGVSGVPETFLVGSDGTVLAKHSGPLTAADARRMLAKVGNQRAAVR